MRTSALLSALILAGCSCDGGPHEPDVGRPPPSAPEALDAQDDVAREWLRAQAISDTHFGARVLYTWLQRDEVDAMQAGTSITLTPAPDPLDEALHADTSDAARTLLDATHTGRRRAWPTAWATRLGWAEGQDVAEHLARVELRSESLLLVYDARVSPPAIRFATDEGASAPFAEAMRVPELWAAVLFVQPHARAYVLVSPSMIGRVSMGSPEIVNELRTERERLWRLAQRMPGVDRPLGARMLARAWASLPATNADLDELYAAALASGDRSPWGRHAVIALSHHVVDASPPWEWRTTRPSESRPDLGE